MNRGVHGLLAVVAIACCGCGTSPTAPARQVELPPNLIAFSGHLHWESIPIGGIRPAVVSDAHTLTAVDEVVLGTGCLPTVREAATGTFEDYRVRFFINDTLWWDFETSAAAPRTTYGWRSHKGKGYVPAWIGEHEVRVVLDATNRHAESSEDDNEVRFTIKVVPPDLTAGMIEVLQWQGGRPQRVDQVRAGSTVQVVAWSFARGQFANHRSVLEAGTSPLFDHRVTLRGGTIFPDIRTDTVTFVPATPGTSTIRLRVDPDGEFLDGNRANNTSSFSLQVLQ